VPIAATELARLTAASWQYGIAGAKRAGELIITGPGNWHPD
jgi:hypothetical protein